MTMGDRLQKLNEQAIIHMMPHKNNHSYVLLSFGVVLS